MNYSFTFNDLLRTFSVSGSEKKVLKFVILKFLNFFREKFRGSEHFFWDYILNTRKANALRVDHKKSPKNPFFSFYWKIIQLKSKPQNQTLILIKKTPVSASTSPTASMSKIDISSALSVSKYVLAMNKPKTTTTRYLRERFSRKKH
jgi:hypothetical protein